MPHRLVLSVFKTIAVTMVLLFVADMTFYLYKAFNVNRRMETIMVSMQKTVSENNYLPEGEYNMYMAIFDEMGDSLNGRNNDDSFVVKNNSGHYVTLNYDTAPEAQNLPEIEDTDGQDLLGDTLQLAYPNDYGDVAYIEASIEIVQPIWFFSGKRNASNWTKSDTNTLSGYSNTRFYYTYFVPCLKYQAVTN